MSWNVIFDDEEARLTKGSSRKSFRHHRWVSRTALASAGALLFNILTAPWAEANFWKERHEFVSSASQPSKPYSAPSGVPAPQLASAALPLLPALAKPLPVVSQNFTTYIDKTADQQEKNIPVWLASLPSAFGDVQQVWSSSSRKDKPWVVLIQDAHAVASAQKNIAHILDHLQGVDQDSHLLVGLEGAAGSFDLAPLRGFPDADVHATVTDYLLENAFLSGPEYFAVNAKREPLLWGVESKDLYLGNIEAYRDGLKLKADLMKRLGRYESRLVGLRKNILTPELAALDRSLMDYSRGRTDLLSHVRQLTSWAGDGIKKFPAIQELSDVLAQEAVLDFKAVEADRGRLLAVLAPSLKTEEAQALVQMSAAYKAGNIGYSDFYGYFCKLAESKNISLKKFPAFEAYVHYVSATEKIDRYALFDQVERLSDYVVEHCSATKDQQALLHLDADLCLAQRLMDRELGSAEWKKYLGRRDGIHAAARRVGELSGRNEFDSAEIQGFASEMESMEAFYRVADQRNGALVNNFLAELNRVSGLDGKKSVALVTGGFHTPELARLLKEKNFSYAVITPKVGEVGGRASKYLDVFAVNHTPLEKMLLGERLDLAPFHTLDTPVSPDGASFQRTAIRTARIAALNAAILRAYENANIRMDDFNRWARAIASSAMARMPKLFGPNPTLTVASGVNPNQISFQDGSTYWIVRNARAGDNGARGGYTSRITRRISRWEQTKMLAGKKFAPAASVLNRIFVFVRALFSSKRRAPESARLTGSLIRLPFVARIIDDKFMGPFDHMRRIFNFLMQQDEIQEQERLDLMVVFGSNDLRILDEVAQIWKLQAAKGNEVPVVLTGGRGRLTDELRSAIQSQYPGELQQYFETHNIESLTEAQMMHWVLTEKLGLREADFIMEPSATNGKENVVETLKITRVQELLSTPGAKNVAAFHVWSDVQRAQLTFTKVLEDYAAKGHEWAARVNILRRTVPPAGALMFFPENIRTAFNSFTRILPNAYPARGDISKAKITPGLLRSYEVLRPIVLSDAASELGWEHGVDFGDLLNGMSVAVEVRDSCLVLTDFANDHRLTDREGRLFEPRLFLRRFDYNGKLPDGFRSGIDRIVQVGAQLKNANGHAVDVSHIPAIVTWAGKTKKTILPVVERVALLIGLLTSAGIIATFLGHYSLLPHLITALGGAAVGGVKTMAPKDWYSRERTNHKWVEENTPSLTHYTWISLQMEAALDQGIVDRIRRRYILNANLLIRHLSQVYMTGGLGALMRDLFPAWALNGMDVVSFHPLYDETVKENPPSPIGGLPQGKTFGDVMRETGLSDTGIEFPITLNAEEFYQQSTNPISLRFKGKDLHVHVYEGSPKFGEHKLFYFDAFALEEIDGKPQKLRVFDGLYPDNDFRDFQMAVYNEAAQEFILRLQKLQYTADGMLEPAGDGQPGLVKENVILIENEVPVCLPKPNLPWAVRIAVNHTVVPAGMWKIMWYSRFLSGFVAGEAEPYMVDGKIHLENYIARSAHQIIGVGVVEHTKVLKDVVFAGSRKVMDYVMGGIRNTNGVFRGNWEAPEVRELINRYKSELGIDLQANDGELFLKLDAENGGRKRQFMDEFEVIKCYLSLKTLLWMFNNRKVSSWGGNWLESSLARIESSPQDIINLDYQGKLLEFMKSDEAAPLRAELLAHPMASNVRRKVSYKGPDRYAPMLETLLHDPQKLQAFRDSGTRLIIGGRDFDPNVNSLIELLKWRVQNELHLEDQICFIEDYNSEDAHIIFQGMNATVMLSDEFLEASATSMMKGVLSGDAFIGVLGGAHFELLKFLAVDLGEELNGKVLDLIAWDAPVEEKHDLIRQWMREGRIKLLNGFLVPYLDVWNNAVPHGRRPDFEKLLQAFLDLGTVYRNKTSRQGLVWNALGTSSRVDAQLSQARGHFKIAEAAVAQMEEFREILGKINISPETARTILEGNVPFNWGYRPNGNGEVRIVREGGRGIQNFINDYYNVIRHQDPRIREAILWHHNNQRDLIAYLKNSFLIKGNPAGLNPILNKLIDLDEKAADEPKLALRTDFQLEALDFVDRLIPYLRAVAYDPKFQEHSDTPVNFSTMAQEPAESPARFFSVITRGMEWRIIDGLRALGISDDKLHALGEIFDGFVAQGIFGPVWLTSMGCKEAADYVKFLYELLDLSGVFSSIQAAVDRHWDDPEREFLVSLYSHEQDAHRWAETAAGQRLVDRMQQWLNFMSNTDVRQIIEQELPESIEDIYDQDGRISRATATELVAQVLSYVYAMDYNGPTAYVLMHDENLLALIGTIVLDDFFGGETFWQEIVRTFPADPTVHSFPSEAAIFPPVESAVRRLFGTRRNEIAAQLGIGDENLFDLHPNSPRWENLKGSFSYASVFVDDLRAAATALRQDRFIGLNRAVDSMVDLSLHPDSKRFVSEVAVQDLATTLIPMPEQPERRLWAEIGRWILSWKIAAQVSSIKNTERAWTKLGENIGGFVDATRGISPLLTQRLAKSENMWIAITDGPSAPWDSQAGPRRVVSLRDVEIFAAKNNAIAVQRDEGHRPVSISVDILIRYLQAENILTTDQIRTLQQIIVTPTSPLFQISSLLEKRLGFKIKILEWVFGYFFEWKPGEFEDRLKFENDVNHLIARFA